MTGPPCTMKTSWKKLRQLFFILWRGKRPIFWRYVVCLFVCLWIKWRREQVEVNSNSSVSFIKEPAENFYSSWQRRRTWWRRIGKYVDFRVEKRRWRWNLNKFWAIHSKSREQRLEDPSVSVQDWMAHWIGRFANRLKRKGFVQDEKANVIYWSNEPCGAFLSFFPFDKRLLCLSAAERQ